MRRHFRWRRISFSVSETGTREGRGERRGSAPAGQLGSHVWTRPSLTSRHRAKRQGSRQLGSGSRRSCWACAQTWVLVEPDRTGPAAAEVPSGPPRGRRVPGGSSGDPRTAASGSRAAAHGSARGRGGATSPRCRPRPAPGSGPAPRRPRLRALGAGGRASPPLCSNRSVSRPLCPPLTPRPPPAISPLERAP